MLTLFRKLFVKAYLPLLSVKVRATFKNRRATILACRIGTFGWNISSCTVMPPAGIRVIGTGGGAVVQGSKPHCTRQPQLKALCRILQSQAEAAEKGEKQIKKPFLVGVQFHKG